MYARTGTLVAAEGRGAELAEVLLRAADVVDELDGSIQYLVGRGVDPDAVVVFEVWETEEAHAASLGHADVRALIEEARPLIVSMESGAEAHLLGGLGL